MVKFRVSEVAGSRERFEFSVSGRMVLVAGSRHLEVAERSCRDVLEGFHNLGFHFFVGCAGGVDESFRRALSDSPFREDGYVACAFSRRTFQARSMGLRAYKVVPEGLHPKAALRRRTLWMVKRSSLVVLFPESPYDGKWGPGSHLVFRASMYHLKPVFIVAKRAPEESVHYRVAESELFAVVRGYWIVPHTLEEGGLCDDED